MVVGTDIESLARGIGESRQSVRFRTPDTVTQAAHGPKRETTAMSYTISTLLTRISSLPGTVGLPPFIFFSTSCNSPSIATVHL
jgi:hypothetical protein